MNNNGAMAIRSTALHQQFGLFLIRFCTSAWIGAAALFVIVGVLEVTRGGFDSATKDALVVVRFPAYYVFGATFIGTGWMGGLLAGNALGLTRIRRMVAMVSLSVVLVIMASDYLWIYLPLQQMVTPPGQSKPASFVGYHEASKWINLTGLLFCMVAMTSVNWPTGKSPNE